jgi:hypothetical protein
MGIAVLKEVRRRSKKREGRLNKRQREREGPRAWKEALLQWLGNLHLMGGARLLYPLNHATSRAVATLRVLALSC